VVHVAVPGGVRAAAEDLHLRVLPQVHEDFRHITTSCGSFLDTLSQAVLMQAIMPQCILIEQLCCCRSSNNSELLCLCCCHCGTAAVRVHPVHLMNIARALGGPNFGISLESPLLHCLTFCK